QRLNLRTPRSGMSFPASPDIWSLTTLVAAGGGWMPASRPPEIRQDTDIDEAAVAEFAAVHRAPVIGPADVRFDGERRPFRALLQVRPERIARPIGVADVAAAIGFARARGLGVSVRGGGHSVAGHPVGHASLMIDLRLLREVTVEADAQRALVGGGACWNDLDAATQAAELALPGGAYRGTRVGWAAATR